MKRIVMAAALIALGAGAAHAQTPQPADWTILNFTADVNKPADIAWDRIGGHDWCGIARFLDRLKGCTINSGTGEVGSVRTVMVGTTATVEIAVARTPLSYTYAQPFTPIFYHGTMGVEPSTPPLQDRLHPDLEPDRGWRRQGPGRGTRRPPEELPGGGGQDGGSRQRAVRGRGPFVRWVRRPCSRALSTLRARSCPSTKIPRAQTSGRSLRLIQVDGPGRQILRLLAGVGVLVGRQFVRRIGHVEARRRHGFQEARGLEFVHARQMARRSPARTGPGRLRWCHR